MLCSRTKGSSGWFGFLTSAVIVTFTNGVLAADEAAVQNVATAVDDQAETAAEAAQAFRSLDAAALTEVAERLSESTRALQTSGGLAVTQQQLLRLALRVAVQKRDRAALDRLEQVAGKSGHPELAAQIKATRQLLAQARAAAPSPAVSADELSPETLQQYRALRADIAAAQAAGDPERLKTLGEIVASVPELNEKLRQHLQAQLAEAQQAAPEEKDEALAALEKLAAGSRAAQAGVVLIDTNGNQKPLPGQSWQVVPPGYRVEGGVDSYTVTQAGQVAILTAATPRRSGGTPGAYLMMCPKLPLCLVVNNQRIQWATWAGAAFTSVCRSVNSTQYHAVPGLAEIPKGATVIGATGRPAAFVDMKGRCILPVDDMGPINVNGSKLTAVTTAKFDSYKVGPALRVVR